MGPHVSPARRSAQHRHFPTIRPFLNFLAILSPSALGVSGQEADGCHLFSPQQQAGPTLSSGSEAPRPPLPWGTQAVGGGSLSALRGCMATAASVGPLGGARKSGALSKPGAALGHLGTAESHAQASVAGAVQLREDGAWR